MTVIGLDDTNRQFKIIEEDTGIGWAVTFILMAIAVGFCFIMFLDRQPMVEYKIDKAYKQVREECALLQSHSNELRHRSTISDASFVDLDEVVDLDSPSDYPIRAASVKRFNHIQ